MQQGPLALASQISPISQPLSLYHPWPSGLEKASESSWLMQKLIEFTKTVPELDLL